MSIQISLPDLFTVAVSSIGGLGDGLSQLHGKPLFIEKAAAGDKLKIRIIHETKESLRGEIAEILEQGPDRILPPCPYYAVCGGCSLQHISENAYRAYKRKMLAYALAHAGFPNVFADITFLQEASRRRVEFKFDGKNFAYYASRSHELVPVENCLILEPALQKLLAPLARELSGWASANTIKTVSLTLADSGVDMLLVQSMPAENLAIMQTIADALSIARISVNGKIVVSRAPVTMKLGDDDVTLPPGAFLQASREGQRRLTEAVVSALSLWERGGASLGEGYNQKESPHPSRYTSSLIPKGEGISVADLFCGIGTYSFPLSKTAQVLAVESDPGMVKTLRACGKINTQQRDLFKNPLTPKELAKFDAVIINPPRPGAKAQCEQLAKSNVEKLVMVSCNPASFARDAKILKNAGFMLDHAQGIDQFVYSPHLEIVAIFSR